MLNAGAMRDSVSGDLAAFFAGGLLPKKMAANAIEIQRPSEPGKPVWVVIKDETCPPLELMPRWMFPLHPCNLAKYSVSAEAHGGLTFQNFSFDSSGPASPAKIAYLGEVRALAFHATVEFHEVVLANDSNPYLWPLEAVTSVTNDKGKVVVSNRYSAKNNTG